MSSCSSRHEFPRAQPNPLIDNGSISTAANDNLPVHEDKQRGVYVKNLSDFYVGNAAEVYEIMRQGGSARAVSATSTSCPCSLCIEPPSLTRDVRPLQT